MSASDTLTIVGFVITLVVAIVGWSWLARADRRSLEAIRLARSAEERAERQEAQAREVDAVEWARVPHSTNLTFQNIGSGQAYNVRLIVDPLKADTWWRRCDRDMGHVAPTERIAVDMKDDPLRFAEDGARIECRARLMWETQSGFAGVSIFPEIVF